MKTKSTVARRRVKRRQERVSHKKLRTLRSRKYARKTARTAKKVMRGGLLNAVKKQITVKAYGTPVTNAFTLSYRRSFTNKTTVLLELVIDISQYRLSISLILDTLLSELFGSEYNLKLNSSIFDGETSKEGIQKNQKLLNYTSGKTFDEFNNHYSTGIYKDWDGKVNSYHRNSDMDKLSDREIGYKKIQDEIDKMNKTIESKVSFSISIENGNITIKELKKTTIFCSPATVSLAWKHTGRSYGTAKVGKFCEVSHDVETKVTSSEFALGNITIESIIDKLTEIKEIHATKFVEKRNNEAKLAAEEAKLAAEEAEQVRKAAKEKEIEAEAVANEQRRKDAEHNFDTTFTSTTKEQLKEAIGKISEFTMWMSDWKKKNKADDDDDRDKVVKRRKHINAAFLVKYTTEEQRKEITDSLKLCRQTYQTYQTSQNPNEKKIFIDYFTYTMVADYRVRYRLQKYLELSDSDIEKYYENNELTSLWSKVIEYIDNTPID